MKLKNHLDEEAQPLCKRDVNKYDSSNTQGTNDKSNSANTIEINENTSNFDLYKGIVFMLISCLFKSVYSILLKYAMNNNPELTPFQLMTWRTYIMVWLCVILALIYKNQLNFQGINKKSFYWCSGRSLLAVVSTPLVICSLKELHISDAYSIFYIYPGLIILFSLGTKQKKVGFFDYICLVTCFIGVIFIVKPDILVMKQSVNVVETKNESHDYPVYDPKQDNFFRTKYFFFLLVGLSAIVKALEDICVKEAGNKVHFLLYPIMYVCFGMLFFPVILVCLDEKIAHLRLIDYGLLLGIASCSIGYISFMALGLQNENAGRVSMINYLQVVFMYFSDIFMFSKVPTMTDFIGMMLIFSFNTANGVYKAVKRSTTLEGLRNKMNN